MKAVVLEAKHEVRVRDFPEPAMDDDRVKIAVCYCGICGTDFVKYEGKNGSRKLVMPVPLGHEVSGIVVETGKNVRQFKKGDRVVADPNASCGKCYFCRRGLPQFCENAFGAVKGMAEYICPPERNVYHIPDSLDMREASLAEPLSCCIHGMDLLDVHMGDTVAIVGFGMIGSIMISLCKLASAAEIVVIETDETKREKALKDGAALFVNPAKENPSEAVAKAGIGNVNRVMECVGLPVTVATALEVAGKGSTVVLFGVGDPEKPISFNPYDVWQKELNIRMSYLNPYTTERAVRLLNSHAVNAKELISRIITPEEVPEEMKSRKLSRLGKVLVKMREATDGILC